MCARPASHNTEMSSTSACNSISSEVRDNAADKLLLCHDGIYYTHPDSMKGVPVDKIDSDHPYWETYWPDLRVLVRKCQQFWMSRYEIVRQSQEKAKMYHYNRQVNRGTTILAFLADGKISPYQLLSKSYMKMVGKGSISSYDTLYRLCRTVEELCKFNLDVDPVDWLRLRLNELIEEHGPEFNLCRTIFDFYHDAKLAQLRERSGFTRIGRPPCLESRSEKSSRALKRAAAHSGRSSDATPTKKTTDHTRQNEAMFFQPMRHSTLPSFRNILELCQKTSSEDLKRTARDVGNQGWQLLNIAETTTEPNHVQDLQLCRQKDMESVNQTRLVSSWCKRNADTGRVNYRY